MGSLGIKVWGLNSDVLYRFTYLEHDKLYLNFSVSEKDTFKKKVKVVVTYALCTFIGSVGHIQLFSKPDLL